MKVWIVTDYFNDEIFAVCDNVEMAYKFASAVIHKELENEDTNWINYELTKLDNSYKKNKDYFLCNIVRVYSSNVNKWANGYDEEYGELEN